MRKKMIKAAIRCGVSAFLLGFSYYAMYAHVINHYDSSTKKHFDGFGREIQTTPTIIHELFLQGGQWLGWKEFLIQNVVFWGGLAMGAFAIKFLNKKYALELAEPSAAIRRGAK